MDVIFQNESFDVFQCVIQEVLSHLYYLKQTPSMYLESDVFEKAKQEVKTIIYDCDFDINKITELLINTKAWEKDKMSYFLKLLENQRTELLSAALNHYNSTRGETIEDFDWLLKCVLGTSELKTLNYSFLQLTLSLLNSSGERKKIMFDINKDMLSRIIMSLENICVQT